MGSAAKLFPLPPKFCGVGLGLGFVEATRLRALLRNGGAIPDETLADVDSLWCGIVWGDFFPFDECRGLSQPDPDAAEDVRLVRQSAAGVVSAGDCSLGRASICWLCARTEGLYAGRERREAIPPSPSARSPGKAHPGFAQACLQARERLLASLPTFDQR